ncbi:MAG: hypothetical protein K2H23_08080 [Oscillospiraceae bacterium]|nr:hypothetical protein [Oscillospiraceae bacterium]
MSDFIREFFDSDICEANQYHKLPDKANKALENRSKIYDRLARQIDKKDLALLDEYVEMNIIIMNEEIFHAYCCGMRDLIRFSASLFNEK